MTAVTERQKGQGGIRKNSPWGWFLEIFVKPKLVFKSIKESDRKLWVKPMLVLTGLLIILSLVSGPARLTNAQMSMTQPPEDFQYWTTEQQDQFFESQQAMQGPLFIYVFPLLGSLISFWLGWFILGSIFHLLMTFKGSRQPQGVYLSLVAWAAVPFILRCLVQILAVLISHRVIDNPGLSGFVNAGESGVLSLVQILLGFVDVYALGFAALLLIGAPVVSGLKPEKSTWVAALGILIFIVLAVLPKFAVNQIGGLGTIRPFIPF
jgi:hypothetical protein